MADIGPFELIIVLVIALLVLGPKRLPDAGKSLGKGIREFRSALSGEAREDDTARATGVIESTDTPETGSADGDDAKVAHRNV
jgi:sec-independent protein translocase protein TatA